MKRLILVCVMAVAMVGCASSRQVYQPSPLTPGMTKKYIYPGKTTQAEIMEIFGPPDLVTHKDGREIWTYDKISQEVSSSGGYLTILIAGYSKERSSSSNRSIMLIVYFNEKDVVIDYKLSAAQF